MACKFATVLVCQRIHRKKESDGFRFTARFYGAATPLIDASYDMPGVVRVD